MTKKTIDWLNANRFRSYPFVDDEGLLDKGRRIPDCVLLDCLVFDTRALDHVPELVFTGIDVDASSASVAFEYDGIPAVCTISGDAPSGFVSVKSTGCSVPGNRAFDIKLVFSPHAYILNRAGEGSWRFRGRVLPSKVVSTRASGVSGLSVGGSLHVGPGGEAKGVVRLEDGYRTMPTVRNGRVVVRVGRKYGLDPCTYPGYETQADDRCEDHLLFFCGQNAIDSGNVVLRGGPGVSVSQGRKYVAKADIADSYGNVGIRAGEEIPCIEVAATGALLNMYVPSDAGSSENGGNQSPDGV